MVRRGITHFCLLAGSLTALLAGCSTGEAIVEQSSRDIAKAAVNNVVADKFPGVNAAPYTDCIIDNASTQEIFSLSRDAVTQNATSATETVFLIAGRPETTKCIANNALGGLLG